jgi:nucleotide-binding universal stress UspA family protein
MIPMRIATLLANAAPGHRVTGSSRPAAGDLALLVLVQGKKERPMAQRPRHIVVAYDFSTPADRALELAIETAQRDSRAVLHVLAAIPPDHGLPFAPAHKVDYTYAEHVQQRLGERIRDAFGASAPAHEIHYFVHARIGAAAAEILQLAQEVGAELILIGSHGRTGLPRALLGSVSEKVVREALCPVLVARARTYTDVELLDVVATEGPHHAYVKPHRYSYVDRRVQMRPADWPLN